MRWIGRALAALPRSMGGTRAERGVMPDAGSVPCSAVLRFAAMRPDFLPADPTPEAFVAWCLHHGADPAQESHADICELAGWPLPEIAVPPAPTVEIAVTALMPPLDPATAARRFLDWVQEFRREGHYYSDELRDLYLEHAADIDHEPTPQESLRREIAKLGIRKNSVTTGMRANSGAPRQERRMRSVRWALFPSLLSEELPWTDLPERSERSTDKMAA